MTISQREGVCRMSTDPMYREMVKLTRIMTTIDKRLEGIEKGLRTANMALNIQLEDIEKELRTANMALNREAEKGDGQDEKCGLVE